MILPVSPRGADQDMCTAGHQGLAALPARRSMPDAAWHGRAFRPGAGTQADPAGKGRPRGLHALFV